MFSLLLLLAECRSKIEFPKDANVHIIPKPAHFKSGNGFFHFKDLTISGPKKFQKEMEEFIVFCAQKMQVNIQLAGVGEVSDIILEYDDETAVITEGYKLHVSEKGVKILIHAVDGSSSPALATIKQLALLNNFQNNYFLPLMEIEDKPKFEHRGLLLDCSRHFFSVDVLKKYIDMLAFYKMNVLHWHLTEDQGWRIEIDKYPKLTETGAFRTEKDGTIYGGFYTKKQIKEIVQYALERNITIIPEIELPGHSQAAIASYPHLSCTGEQVEVINDWGVFKEIYCAGNDSTFTFLEDVLTEVIELFPSNYVHIGGDEAPKIRWEKCEKCQKRMHDNHLENEQELQSYFIKRIQTFLKSKNRELIGWDEILEGGLAAGAVVQSWRGMEGGVEAARHGNRAIMSPTSHAYLDYSLSAIDLEKVYSFNPIPKELTEEEAELIIGGEVNMWTERVPNEANLDSKVFPRMLAMSEVLWTGTNDKNYQAFLNRVYDHYPILKQMNIEHGIETTPFEYEIKTTNKNVNVRLKKNVPNTLLNVSLNNKNYDLPEIGKDFTKFEKSSLLTFASIDDKSIGDTIPLHILPHFGLLDKVSYANKAYSKWYTGGGDSALVDGVLGSLDFRDGHWQGFWGNDLECTIESGPNKVAVKSVSANFYQYNNSWIFIPKEMFVEYTTDGKNWQVWGRATSDVDLKKRGQFIHTLKVTGGPEHFSALRIKVKNQGKVPDWHEAAGSDAWIFIDEIILQ